jgi:hypothetical protein
MRILILNVVVGFSPRFFMGPLQAENFCKLATYNKLIFLDSRLRGNDTNARSTMFKNKFLSIG